MAKEVDNIVSEKIKIQDINLNQIKLKVNDAYEKDEKITTNFDPSKDEDAITKRFFDGKTSKKESHLILVEKDYNELIFHS